MRFVVQRFERATFVEVGRLPESPRGAGGYGSTGGHAGTPVTPAAPTDDQGGISFGKRVGDGTSLAVERLSQVAAHDRLQDMLADVVRAEQRLLAQNGVDTDVYLADVASPTTARRETRTRYRNSCTEDRKRSDGQKRTAPPPRCSLPGSSYKFR